MKKSLAPPGVMIYFEIEKPMARLTAEEKGNLFDAILAYAHHGVLPDLEGSVGVAWDFIADKIDRDVERYKNAVMRKAYGGYQSACKKEGVDPLVFAEWAEKEGYYS